MADQREVESLNLVPSMKSMLRSHGMLYVSDLKELGGAFELAQYLGVESQVALEVLRAAEATPAQLTSSEWTYNALKRVTEEKGVITFVKSLDVLLGNGAAIGQITEFAGTPGVGKTQMAIQLCLDVQIPTAFAGIGGRAVYIDTEGAFWNAMDRVSQMAEAVVKHLRRSTKGRDGAVDEARAKIAADITAEGFLQGIDCYRAHTRSELMAQTAALDARLALDPTIKLVVIDSVAFPFRTVGMHAKDAARVRDRELQDLAATLHRLAFERRVAVVVMNHLGLKFDKVVQSFALAPVLGEVWHHAVSTRVLLYQQPRDDASWGVGTGVGLPHHHCRRVAQLVKSTRQRSGAAFFRIVREGVREDKPTTVNENGKRPLDEA